MSHSHKNQFVLVAVLVFTFMSCAPASLFSEYWNKPDMKLFERIDSPYDDSPDAVVLFDLERMSIDSQEWDVVRERHVRIQIFTEAGKEYADVRIPFWHEHTVSAIKAQTILPDGRRIMLDPANIFEEGDKESWLAKVFALPGVEDQCIVEYQYKYRATSIGVIRPKYFQGYLRTEYALFSMSLPQGFEYTASTKNIPKDLIAPERLEIASPDRRDITRYTWEFKDIPPIKDEPFMYNREDHLYSINMQMVRYKGSWGQFNFIKEWEDLTKLLLEDYASFSGSSRPLRKLLEEILPEDSSAGLQPRDIFLFVRDEITRSSSRSIRSDQMHEVIRDRQGSPVEKNLLLSALLKEAGYMADPVLIAKRDYGIVSYNSPSLNDFNHLIVRLSIDRKLYLMDAGSPYSTFDRMPLNNYSGLGLLLAKGDAVFIEFPTEMEASKRDVVTNCKLDASGTLSGSFQISSSGSYAVGLRAGRADALDDKTFAYDEIVNHIPGVVIDSVNFEMNMADMRKPVLSTIYFQIPDYFVIGSEMVYLPSTLYHGFQTNQLVKESRSHPVEFSMTLRLKESVNLEIPPGYEIIETPEIKSIAGPGIAFQKLVRVSENGVQISWNEQIIKLVHAPESYEKLRNFYTEAVAIDQAVIVIKREG